MNKESNSYTLIYASVMVTLVALALALTSELLRPQQAKNEAVDKMRQILYSLNLSSAPADAEALYQSTIVDAYRINARGIVVEGAAFDVELADELRKPAEKRIYPVFEAKIDGEKKYVLSLRGTGLWGPVWGYIALNSDKKTVYGASFGHESETPGLGGEIDKPAFAQAFQGKRIFDSTDQFTSIAIVKPGRTVHGRDAVDGISGGTITSQGVDAMLFAGLKSYLPFLER
ncbi:MAG: NADH:ubiquinone reductase (Na(+)-transporting) subunit C [Dysgonamonadaceae bacterium]|jgi:Na+-transporting NADH:ubiquinone oxidoreductase subunit C|nr:NADH:ubiquinone reductase (Na(+)-transporting) subunit C [Dysgonamonadaceae bacterium]